VQLAWLRAELGIQQQTFAHNLVKQERTLSMFRFRKGAFFNETGATAVEFALILPLLLVLIIGLIDFGRMGFVQVSVTSASREGARYSSLYSSGLTSTQLISDFVQTTSPSTARVSQLDSTGALTVTASMCSSTTSGENTSVTVTTNFKWLLPVNLISIVNPSANWINDFTISSTGVMRCMN
jgi:Flp pilus assembly protein TadG